MTRNDTNYRTTSKDNFLQYVSVPVVPTKSNYVECRVKMNMQINYHDLTTGQRTPKTMREGKNVSAKNEKRDHAHFIFHDLLRVAFVFVRNHDIQIPIVAGVWCTSQPTFDLFAFVDGYGGGSVEDRLPAQIRE